MTQKTTKPIDKRLAQEYGGTYDHPDNKMEAAFHARQFHIFCAERNIHLVKEEKGNE